MMFFEGYIGAPPTVTVCSLFIICCATVGAAPAKASETTVPSSAMRESVMLDLHHVFGAAQRLADGDTDMAQGGCRMSVENLEGSVAAEALKRRAAHIPPLPHAVGRLR